MRCRYENPGIMRHDRLRLADILEAIGQIEKYSARGRAAFDEDQLIRVGFFTTSKSLAKPAAGVSVVANDS